MPIEIEIKLRCDDHDTLRERIGVVGGTFIKKVLETNTFFDAADAHLLAADCGLRLRINQRLDQPGQSVIITYKGPKLPGPIKRREEIELTVDDPAAAESLLQRLGFTPALCFEKRRETWKLDNCLIELDELPIIGRFVEIEGPDESAVRAVQSKLTLTGELISTGYSTLLARATEATSRTKITFNQTTENNT